METGVTVYNECQTVIPTVMPAKQLTKMELIRLKSQQLANGETTILEIGKELKLTNKQIDFCRYYTTEEFFGNGVKAFGKAYGFNPDNKNERARCSVGASTALRHATILTLIDILLDSEGLNDQWMDRQLLLVATQNADLKAKMLAIKTYNEVTGRVKKQIEINHTKVYDFSQLGKDELAVLIGIAERTRLGNG